MKNKQRTIRIELWASIGDKKVSETVEVTAPYVSDQPDIDMQNKHDLDIANLALSHRLRTGVKVLNPMRRNVEDALNSKYPNPEPNPLTLREWPKDDTP